MNIDVQFGSNSESLSDSQSDGLKILFLDTFTSSANLDNDFLNEDASKKEPNVGLVQFSCPVMIHEVRIIPLSTLVSAESLRTVRLGATIPSSFDIHFYVNDLKAKESSTFLDIGCFAYKEYENYIFKPSVSVATDGLFLRGYFDSVTLAVLGEVTDLSSLLNKEPNSFKLSNDKNFEENKDEDSRTSDLFNANVDIKEPDDTQDYIESVKIVSESNSKNNDSSSRHDEIAVAESSKSSENLVQDVHSLSPSPENITRILSPSPHNFSHRLSITPTTTKSHSNSSRENQRLSKSSHKDYDYDRKKYCPSSSRSSTSSVSPSNYSLKSRISFPSASKNLHSIASKRRRSSPADKESRNDERNSSSSSHQYRSDRYTYSHEQQKYCSSRRSKEHSMSKDLSTSRSCHRYSSRKYSDHHRRSRSRSKDEESDHEHYHSSNHERSISINNSRTSRREQVENKRRSRRSISIEKQNRDNRSSIHSHDSSRDNDNRSICSLTRTRNSSYYGDYSDNNSRDLLSPKNKHQHRMYQQHSSTTNFRRSRSRQRSRSLSPTTVTISHRKRDYHHRSLHHRDSNSSNERDSLDKLDTSSTTASSERKKSRYNTPLNIASPSGGSVASPISVSHYNNKSPVSLIASSKEIESIASPVSPTNDEDSTLMVIEVKDANRSLSSSPPAPPPIHISPHSSISNDSLDQFDCDFKTTEPTNKNFSDEDEDAFISVESSASKDPATEFFEPLSPSDNSDELLLENGNEDNFEQISTSSDVDMDNLEDQSNKQINDNNEKAELEIISSDEEYTDDLNAALASDKVEYAKNYLDTTGGKYDDDEIDSAFDLNKNLFDPFVPNQLNPLKFPFNSNKTTTFIDLKLFQSIMKFVNDSFADLYKVDNDQQIRKAKIQENWVKNVEKLAGDIMKLTCPIYYSFTEDSDIFTKSEQDIESMIPLLISITKDGLDYDLALAQKQIPFKVRHIKAGIKLLIALFSSFDIRSSTSKEDEKLFKKLFDEDLPYDLLKLYNKSFMTLSLRLLILNGLIVICDHPEGVEYLCHKKFDWTTVVMTSPYETDYNHSMLINPPDPVILTEELKYDATCYQYILSLILAQQNTRLTSVFEELLDKIHLFELFKTLSSIKMPLDDGDESLCNIFLNTPESPSNEDDRNLHAILSQMSIYFDRFSNRIHRALRLLPNIYQYEIKTAVHTSIPLLLLSTSDSTLENVPNRNQFEYIHERFHCEHTYCSSSKIGFFSQKSFYRFFKHFDLFKSLIQLLKFLKNSCHNRSENSEYYLCDKILKLLDIISSHQQGLKFLLEDQQNVDYVNLVHSILVDFSSWKKNEKDDQFVNKVIDFGVKFITRLYTFNLIDNILYNIYSYQKENLKKTNPSTVTLVDPSKNTIVIDSLLRLFMMVHFEKAIFRDTVVSILTMEHNFDAIYSFIVPITSQFDPGNAHFVNEKISNADSTSFIYATKIAITCVQYLPERNLLHFYETYGNSLLKNSENVQTFVQNSLVKLHRSDIFQSHILKYSTLINWIAPLKNDNLNSHDELILRKFVTILKKHHDAFQEKFNTIDNYIDRVFFIEPELVTAIKILVALCDPKANYLKNQEPDIQLKYKYSLVSCFCFDCMSYLLTLLEAVIETCERPSHQTFAYTFNDSYINLFVKNYLKTANNNNSNSNNSQSQQQSKPHSLQQLNNSILHQGSLIIEFIRPSVRFLRLILDFLMASIGHRLNDSTPIPILLKLYNILTYFPSSSKSENIYKHIELSTKSYAKSIQQEIIEILSVYTTVYVEHSESEESLRKSVWTKMLKHVFEFMLLAPKYFASGLEILSKILPTPLPLIVNKPLTENESIFIINYRKLWSAHLHCMNDDLENMINCLVLTNSLQVQTLLRIVCHKMCDLFTATVLTISKTITEFLVHTISDILESKSSNDQQKIDPKYYCNNCIKIIDFILDLFVSSLSFRIGILNAFYCFAMNSDTSHKESKIHKFFHKMFEFLNRKKFGENLIISSVLLVEILSDNNKEESDDETHKNLLNLLEQYFDTNENISTLKTFKFSDKLTSKFFVACSQSLNQYFTDRRIYIIGPNNISNPDDIENEERFSTNDDEMNLIETANQQDNVIIYSHQFSRLSVKCKMPEVWNSLAERNNKKQDLKKMDLVELSKKYLNIDSEGLIKILSNYYSPIVELPETPEKPSDDSVTKLSNMNPQPKRGTLRGRGRLYGHRGDPFRSRPPNTSRPPSMHVDDFVAMEQRSDPLACLVVNKNRSNHMLHVSTNVLPSHSSSSSSLSSYGGKHSDYIRKKNFNSHHSIHSGHSSHMSSSPYHSNYSSTIKSNMMNNNNSSGNSSHFNKQSG